MKNLLLILFLLVISVFPFEVSSQTMGTQFSKAAQFSKKAHPQIQTPFSESSVSTTLAPASENLSFPTDPLSVLVSVPGATSIGISGKYYLQGYHALHNIQVDPDNPMNVHAVIMTALNVKPADTAGAQTTSFPQRNVYYTFSSDGGATWKAPKTLATVRSGFMNMILYKRGGVYVPIIVDHHFTSASVTDLFCSVYVESGNPGDGKFLSGDCDRTSVSGTTGDLIWPAIAVSNDGKTLYIISSYAPPTGAAPNSYQNLQFGSFSLDPASGKPSNWSGWQNGPDTSASLPNQSGGFAYAQQYSMSVSAGGKLGITWLNTDYVAPDFSMYFSESKDGGKTWSVPVNFFTNIQTKFTTTLTPDPAIYLRASDGTDLFYDGENATVVFSAYESTLNLSGSPGSTNTYVPASGTLLYWKSGMANSVILVSQVSGDQTVLAPAIDTGAYLSRWDTTHIVDPQGQNLLNSTVARTPDNKIWSILFEAWANNDSGGVYTSRNFDNTADSTLVLPFHSIYRITTTDDGISWVSAPVAMNDMSLPISQHVDYRFPEVSTWNPLIGGVTNYTLFGADTAAGNWINGRDPGFDNIGWFFKKDALGVNGVKTSAIFDGMSLNQNFPNPFTSSTTIPLVMKNDDIVTLSVTDILGREVAIVYHGRLSAGEQRIPFNAPNLSAGIYTYTLKTSTGSVSRTMSLVK